MEFQLDDDRHGDSAQVTPKDRKTGDTATVKQAAQRMVDFIVELTAHAREANSDFFIIPQNGAWIMSDLGSDTTRKAGELRYEKKSGDTFLSGCRWRRQGRLCHRVRCIG